MPCTKMKGHMSKGKMYKKTAIHQPMASKKSGGGKMKKKSSHNPGY